MSKLYFFELDISKGIAIILVLFSHSFIHYPVELADIEWCKCILNIITSFYMPVFFLISGYLFSFSRPRSFMDNFKNKTKRLFLPYFSYEILNLFIKLVAPSLVNRKIDSIGAYLENFLLRGGELWFLYVLFIIFLIWPEVLKRVKRHYILGTVLILAFVWPFLPNSGKEIFLYSRVIYYSIFFLLGFLLKGKMSWIKETKYYIVFSISFVLLNCLLHDLFFSNVIGFYILNIIGCFFIWSLSNRMVENGGDQIAFKFFGFIGKNSLAFYWLNGYALVLARTAIVKIIDNDNTLLLVLCIFVACVIIESLIVISIRRFSIIKSLIGAV